MSRSADYTIGGFLYQFNKSVLEILSSKDDDIINIEGIVEDIEVVSPGLIKAIQCKYHEAAEKYNQSTLYKPILQMINHYAKNAQAEILYVLFAHFPNIDSPPPLVGKDTFCAAIASKDDTLQKIITSIPTDIDIDGFEAKFKMEFGPSFDQLALNVCSELHKCGILKDEIETLAYPNAIHHIAMISMRHDPEERKITKKQLLSTLMTIRRTAISRWTLALATRKKLLDARRKQLKLNLDKNSRLRYFIFEPTSIEDFEQEIVLFISDYLDKYHFKAAHVSTPTFCFCADRTAIQEIQKRLFAKNIVAEDGYIGGEFQETRFFREPLLKNRVGEKIQREFSLRITSWTDHGVILNNKKGDDVFIFGNSQFDTLDTTDVNLEFFSAATLKEIKYMMGVSYDCE